MLSRYKIYEDFFGIEKRAAHYKVKKETLQDNDLKTFEKFVAMLSVEDIEKIIKFVDEESPALNIQLKRSKKTHKIKSSVKVTHELVTVATIDGEIYQAFKEVNKKPEQILLEYKNKLDLDEERREEASKFKEEEFKWIDYCEQQFEDQHDFQSFSAFQYHLEEDDDQAHEIEETYRLIHKAQKKIHIIPEYSHLLYAKETVNIHCHHFFEEKIDLIVDSIAEKNIIQYLLESDSVFTEYLDTFSELLKIPPKLILYFGRESFTRLFKKFQIEYLL